MNFRIDFGGVAFLVVVAVFLTYGGPLVGVADSIVTLAIWAGILAMSVAAVTRMICRWQLTAFSQDLLMPRVIRRLLGVPDPRSRPN